MQHYTSLALQMTQFIRLLCSYRHHMYRWPEGVWNQPGEMLKLQVVHNQLNKASHTHTHTHSHTHSHTRERERERTRSPLDAKREGRKEKKNCFFSRRKKRVSFAVKTFVVELNIWMPQAKWGLEYIRAARCYTNPPVSYTAPRD